MFSYQNQAALAKNVFSRKGDMSEATFCKQFLTALDSRPVKLSSDHVADPKTYPATGAYILPKMPTPKKRKYASAAAPGSTPEPSLKIALHNLRNASQSLTLPDQSAASTSVLDLKTAFAARHNVPADKLRLLFAKKPCADSKTVAEILGGALEEMKEVEFAVMVMPGAGASASASAAPPDPAVTSPPLAPAAPEVTMTEAGEPAPGSQKVGGEVTGKGLLQTEDFWSDLRDFLVQRLRDEGEAVNLAGIFRGAWESSTSKP